MPVRRPPRAPVRPQVEPLEDRSLPSGVNWPVPVTPVTAAGTNASLDLAQDLGTVGPTNAVAAVGTIGQGTGGPAEVDWYQFTLATAATVHLDTLDSQAGSPFVSVLSLYDNDPSDPANNYFGDPNDPLGHRLLAQADGAGSGGDAAITRNLAAGTYWVAVSGHGNSYFDPFLADSGLPGSTGAYNLLVTAAGLNLNPAAGPVVLATDPGPGSASAGSPLEIYADLSAAPDANTLNTLSIDPNQVAQLTYNPTGQFGNGSDTPINLIAGNYSTGATELQFTPETALAPGYYQLSLAGINFVGGASSATFRITGYEGNTTPGAAADDTPATAHNLGNITSAGIVQAAGAIGDDPYYDPYSADPVQSMPGNDVDLYHFRVSGPGNFVLTAETFAGRIGSPLFAQNSLFEATAGPGGTTVYTLIGTNSGTFNQTTATGPVSQPLANDPLLFAGLTAGDYYLAVSSTGNTPDLTQPSHSSANGWSTGRYVLNLLVQPDDVPPRVTAVSLADGTTLTAPPTTLTVRFSEQVNLPGGSVFVQASDGTKYAARLESYDPSTNQASFLMLDGLPNGAYQLHLSGAAGLTDLAGNPLVGNDPSGDYVVHFTVNGPARGTTGNPLLWTDQGANTSAGSPQNLGPLFPNELQSGVTITRSFNVTPAAAGDTADYYQFQLLQSAQAYGFSLFKSASLPAGVQLTLTDSSGHTYRSITSLPPTLGPGTYTLGVTGLPTTQPLNGWYRVVLTLATGGDNPPPLTAGPMPALRLRLAANPPAAPAPSPPTVTLPAPSQVTPAILVSASDPPPAASIAAVLSAAATPGAVPAALLAASLTGPSGAEFPAGSLSALAALPVGGARDAGAAASLAPAARLVLPGPGSPPTSTFIVPAASPAGAQPGGDDVPSSGPAWDTLLKSSVRFLEKFWQQFSQDQSADMELEDGWFGEGSEGPLGLGTRFRPPAPAEAAEASDEVWCSLPAGWDWSHDLALLGSVAALSVRERGTSRRPVGRRGPRLLRRS